MISGDYSVITLQTTSTAPSPAANSTPASFAKAPTVTSGTIPLALNGDAYYPMDSETMDHQKSAFVEPVLCFSFNAPKSRLDEKFPMATSSAMSDRKNQKFTVCG